MSESVGISLAHADWIVGGSASVHCYQSGNNYRRVDNQEFKAIAER